MDKKDNKTPSYVMPNNQYYAGEPIGYPDMSGRDPLSYNKITAKGFKPFYYEGPQSHSTNPEAPRKYKLTK